MSSMCQEELALPIFQRHQPPHGSLLFTETDNEEQAYELGGHGKANFFPNCRDC